MLPRSESIGQAPGAVLSMDLTELFRQVCEEARQAAHEGARQGVASEPDSGDVCAMAG